MHVCFFLCLIPQWLVCISRVCRGEQWSSMNNEYCDIFCSLLFWTDATWWSIIKTSCSFCNGTQANIDWYAYKRIRERKCVNICSGNASIGIFNSYLSRQPLMQCKKKKNDSDHNLLFLQLVFFLQAFFIQKGPQLALKSLSVSPGKKLGPCLTNISTFDCNLGPDSSHPTFWEPSHHNVPVR